MSFEPLKIGGVSYVVASAIPIEDSMALANSIKSRSQPQAGKANALLVTVLVVMSLMAGCLGYWMSRGLNRVLKRISDRLSDGAEQTAAAAGQVSASSHTLAEGASEQAESLEETSSSLEEMSSMTKQNAGNAQNA